MQIKIEKFTVSKRLKLVSWITTIMGLLFFAYPVFYILSLVSELEKYKAPLILDYLNQTFFLRAPILIASHVPSEISSYIVYSVIYVLFAILMMILSNFLLERNLLAIAFCLVLFTTLTVSEYLIIPEININTFWQNMTFKFLFFLLFALIPLILLVLEILIERDFKDEQLYVQIITSALIISVIVLCFRGVIWLIKNKQWLIETFS